MIPVLKTGKELGINMDELPDGTRASMEGQVTDKTFEDWLKRKTESDPTFADRTLGKGRAELWRNNKITMDQMISGGQPLSLSELQAKYGKAIPPKVLTIDDYIKHGNTLTKSLSDGSVNPRLLHSEIINKLKTDVGTNTPCQVQTKGVAAKLVKTASQLFPDSWTKKTDDFGDFFVKSKAKTRGWCLTLNKGLEDRHLANLPEFGYVPNISKNGYMVVRTGDIGNTVHEYTHRLQSAMPELDSLFQEIHTRRTGGDQIERLSKIYPNNGYREEEYSRKDKYINAYQGKEYNGKPKEVMTMAMEYVLGLTENHFLSANRLDNFKKFYENDRELFDFTVGVLFKWKP
jgi:hypothetical protein